MELKANEFKHAATIALQDIQLKTALDRGARSADVARVATMNETTDAYALRQQGRGAKLRALSAQIVAELGTLDSQRDELRRQFDHLLLTAHTRIRAVAGE